MKKIILIVISATLLLANALEETKTEAQVTKTQTDAKTVVVKAEKKVEAVLKESKAETGGALEIKKSKRQILLEAELAKKEASRNKQTTLREEKLKKLDADLAEKAKQRAAIIY